MAAGAAGMPAAALASCSSRVSCSSRAWARRSRASRWSVSRVVTAVWASSTIRRTSESTRCSVSGEASAPLGHCGAAVASAGRTAIGPYRVAHARARDHPARDIGELADVLFGAGGDVAVDELLGDASAERDVDLGAQVGARVAEAVGLGRRQRDPERAAARDDRDLADGVGAGGEHPDECMAGLVVGSALARRG